MAATAKSPTLAFAIERLKKNPNLPFADLKKESEKRGLKMVPIVFGRAKLALGIAKKRPKNAPRPLGKGRTGRGPGRPPRGASGFDGSVLHQIEVIARDAQAYKSALDEIRAILNRL